VIGVFYVPEVWLSSWHQNLIATSLFIAAAITDWLDGYLARRLNQTSAFGAFLDPVADKLMIAAALIRAGLAPARGRKSSPWSSSAGRSPFRRCANGWRRSASREASR